jgi:hypothetical protein
LDWERSRALLGRPLLQMKLLKKLAFLPQN